MILEAYDVLPTSALKTEIEKTPDEILETITPLVPVSSRMAVESL